jgi:hypothetical protein
MIQVLGLASRQFGEGEALAARPRCTKARMVAGFLTVGAPGFA